jgi:hypothetical protein
MQSMLVDDSGLVEPIGMLKSVLMCVTVNRTTTGVIQGFSSSNVTFQAAAFDTNDQNMHILIGARKQRPQQRQYPLSPLTGTGSSTFLLQSFL